MVKFLKSITLTLAAVAAMAFGTSAFAQNATKQNNATAQGKNGGKGMMINREKIKAQKIAFFTQELNLTSDEAAKFWPVYNSFADEIKNIKEGRAERMKDSKESFIAMFNAELEITTINTFKNFNFLFRYILRS